MQRSLCGDYTFITRFLPKVKFWQDPNSNCGVLVKYKGQGEENDFLLSTSRLYTAITIAEAIKKLLITGFIPL